MTLDDRIYCLQQTTLPDDLQTKLIDADIAYIQDRDFTATFLVTLIEQECQERGISIFMPKYMNSDIALTVVSYDVEKGVLA